MLRAFVANFQKGIIEFKRYYFNSISGFATVLIFFYLIFFGVKSVSGSSPTFGQTIDGIIVGYFMWLMFIFSFQGIAWGIIEEAQRGTLEQVFVSPIPFEYQMFCRIITDFVINVLLAIPLMYFAAFTTGRHLNFDLITLLYLLIGGTMCALGIGMIMGGIALVFKRISSFIQIVTFGSLAFTMADPGNIFQKLLPMAQASHLMRDLAINGLRITQFPLSEHAVLWGAASMYVLTGILVFRIFEKRAMLTGTLGQY